MKPVKRDLKFQLPADRLTDWHPDGPYVTHFMNTLSVFFPVGERFFIHAVRQFRDQVKDPGLQEAVTAFIGQEAMHGREHEEYNQLMVDAGYPIAEMEERVIRLLEHVKANAPKEIQLAATIALEHFTAMLADKVLEDQGVVDGGEPHFMRLWRWHAYEETEHKAVAFDVWDTTAAAQPGAYLMRVSTLVTATAIFMRHVAEYHWKMINADPRLSRRLGARIKGYAGLARFLFARPGAFRRIIPEWLDYFRPGFHPWDQDNAELLEGLDALAREVAEAA